jgi:hypothetical protein
MLTSSSAIGTNETLTSPFPALQHVAEIKGGVGTPIGVNGADDDDITDVSDADVDDDTANVYVSPNTRAHT